MDASHVARRIGQAGDTPVGQLEEAMSPRMTKRMLIGYLQNFIYFGRQRPNAGFVQHCCHQWQSSFLETPLGMLTATKPNRISKSE
jgi:hypothetical protein